MRDACYCPSGVTRRDEITSVIWSELVPPPILMKAGDKSLGTYNTPTGSTFLKQKVEHGVRQGFVVSETVQGGCRLWYTYFSARVKLL